MPLVITSGEPAGIGPDICLQLAAGAETRPVVVLGDRDLMQQRAAELGLGVELTAWQPGQNPCLGAGQMSLQSVSTATPVVTGQLDPRNAPYVLAMLDIAIAGVNSGHFSGMVTAPVQKSVINEAGIAFSGHTEYLQEAAGVNKVVMMLASASLKVALVTTHLPLRDVADAITPDAITQVTRILKQSLQTQFEIPSPRILVCGLNPHAGENGHLGHEEEEIIKPALEALRAEGGCELIGPLPADTLFTDRVLAQGDAVLAMFHDQGLPVLKYQGFGQAVNITLGLPYVRTSVDHGTALDLAGTGKADIGSMETALRYGDQMVQASTRQR